MLLMELLGTDQAKGSVKVHNVQTKSRYEILQILYQCLVEKTLQNAKSCFACLEQQPNQMAHMGPGGCLNMEGPDADTLEQVMAS